MMKPTWTKRVAIAMALVGASAYAHGWLGALSGDKRVARWADLVMQGSYAIEAVLCFVLLFAIMADSDKERRP